MAGGPVDRPVVAISMGDPAGIGPEVVVKALADPLLRAMGRFIVYGLAEQIEYAADMAEINPYWWRQPHETVDRIESGVVLADFDEFGMVGPGLHRDSETGGQASMRFLAESYEAVVRGKADALVTAPISKTSWSLAGYARWPGHTEWLAEKCQTSRVTMMFDAGDLRVALASTHIGLFDLRHKFTIGLVFQPIDLLATALREWFGVASPRIGVCGLNPHAGEDGRFGDEESRVIGPAITMANQAGIEAEGPFPSDTLFTPANARRYDGIVAMYHDQGLIPIKMTAFDRAVNVTLGLPIIRTSPDHGTAFDIAGRNKADAGSMTAAIRLALRLAVCRAQSATMGPAEGAG